MAESAVPQYQPQDVTQAPTQLVSGGDVARSADYVASGLSKLGPRCGARFEANGTTLQSAGE